MYLAHSMKTCCLVEYLFMHWDHSCLWGFAFVICCAWNTTLLRMCVTFFKYSIVLFSSMTFLNCSSLVPTLSDPFFSCLWHHHSLMFYCKLIYHYFISWGVQVLWAQRLGIDREPHSYWSEIHVLRALSVSPFCRNQNTMTQKRWLNF